MRRCSLRAVFCAPASRTLGSDFLDVDPVTGAGTADEFIEAEVRTLMMSKDPPVIYVATSDRVSGDVSFGSGAVMINSDQFIRNIIKTDEEARAPPSLVPRTPPDRAFTAGEGADPAQPHKRQRQGWQASACAARLGNIQQPTGAAQPLE